jgi:hypothetical protein
MTESDSTQVACVIEEERKKVEKFITAIKCVVEIGFGWCDDPHRIQLVREHKEATPTHVLT